RQRGCTDGYTPQVRPPIRAEMQRCPRQCGREHRRGGGSKLLAEVDEPVHPRHPGTGEDGGTDGDEDADAAFACGGVVAVAGGDGPHDCWDDQHEYRDDEPVCEWW